MTEVMHTLDCGVVEGGECTCGSEQMTASVSTPKYEPPHQGSSASPPPTPKKKGTPVNLNGAGHFLKTAAAIVEGSRQKTHGDKERSFAAAALMWEAYLSARKAGRDSPVRAQDVAQCMSMLKTIRSEHGNPDEPDHYIDGCGYYALFGELAMAEVLGKTRNERELLKPCSECFDAPACQENAECAARSRDA